MRRGAVVGMALLVSVLAFGQNGNESVQSARALYQRGREEQSRSNLLAAVELYRASLQANPAYYQPLIGLAEVFFTLEEYEEALGYLKEAQKYDRDNLDTLVLEGRICVALNRLEQARALFETVLQREKNNLEARFGLAELDIAQGKARNASQRYIETLKIRPESQKALLSLALLNEAEGNREAAETYLELALKYHSYDPRVHFAAGRFSVDEGRLDRAEQYLLTAVALDPDFTRAKRLLAQVYLQGNEPQRSVEVLQGILDSGRNDPLVWYTLGLAYDRSGDTEQAVRSLAQVLRLRPDDEIARIALENIALDKLPLQDPVRERYAAYHLERGNLFRERNLLVKALTEYRRAIRLQPESREARLDFAELYRIMGFPVKYQKELEVLRDLGFVDSIILDNIEIVESSTYDSVSAQWGVDQYALDKKRYSLAVYHLSSATREVHPYAGRITAEYFVDLLRRFPTIDVLDTSLNVDTYERAFREARSLDADYFLVLHLEESERSVTTIADQYLAATGKLLGSYKVFRTGNDRVQDNFNLLSERVHQALPLKATLLDRQFDLGLIDLGRMDGLEEGQELAIVKKGRVRLRNDGIGPTAEEADILGTFTVSRLDENVSEGTVAKKSFFDLINPGDELILPPDGAEEQPSREPEEIDKGLLRRLLGLIGL
jgi:tetratricopeptide (TPR) repeat protein